MISSSTLANPSSSSFRPGFPPPSTNTMGPMTTSATTAAATATRVAVSEQNKRRDRDERLMALQSHMSRGRRVRFGLVRSTATGANNSSNNPRSSSGAFPSTTSNASPQHRDSLTLQNFQHWYSMQSDAAVWAGAGGDGPGAGTRRGHGGRTARVLVIIW